LPPLHPGSFLFPGRNPGGLYPGGLPKAFQRTSKGLLEDLQKTSTYPKRILEKTLTFSKGLLEDLQKTCTVIAFDTCTGTGIAFDVPGL
jgi:hypothetical protein